MSKPPTPSNRPVPTASLAAPSDPDSNRRETASSDEREATLTFDQALAQLEEIIERMERRDAGLEESLAGYEASVKLIKRCRDVLRHAEVRVEELNQLLEQSDQTDDADHSDQADTLDDEHDSIDPNAPFGNR